ncbi:MAG: recombinase family protein [Geodermatophilaceae bacterium]|nr:recombinase family protein [Geodermatophilaceae bacterium]
MSPKITPDHLGRGAVVYVRQSTMGQVVENTESQRRQYGLAEAARSLGFASVSVIDDDLGRSGSGLVERPGFQKLVASVCAGSLGAVFCIEASRLARNGRDWHHLVDLCALVGTLVIDPDGTYDPRLVNDRLLLGLKGTMSEYELSLLRQRGLAARDSKAQRGELRFALPPGYCWNELGQIEMDPDQRITDAIRLVFKKFQELGSARQVMLWLQDAALKLPVMRRNTVTCRMEWRPAAYHTVLQVLRHPVYAGAYVFGRTSQRTRVVDGRARKTEGHSKPRAAWNVLLRDQHPGYISWEQFEANQQLISENAHMQSRTDRKSARGGRALLTGLIRCGRCGRTMRVMYGSASGHAHRYQCRGDDSHVGSWLCIGIGGVRVDRAVAAQIVEAVSDHAIEAAIRAVDQSARADDGIRQAICRELEEAHYEASLAARRHEAVDPTKRLVARELESRWNATLERVADLEARIVRHDDAAALRPKIDAAALMALARDLPTVWNAPGTDARTKQRITHILIREVLIDLDAAANEAVVTVHWVGGRHTELRVSRVRCGRYPEGRGASPVDAVRKLGGQWPDREIASTLNWMRCKPADGKAWTTVRVREMRERLGIAPFDPATSTVETISAERTAARLGICVGSVHKLIREGVLPATQVLASAPWQVPVAALTFDAVRQGVQAIVERRPKVYRALQDDKTLRLPGF